MEEGGSEAVIEAGAIYFVVLVKITVITFQDSRAQQSSRVLESVHQDLLFGVAAKGNVE